MSVFTKDLLERVVMTFLQGCIGSLVVADVANKTMWLAALGGGVAAVVSLVKGVLAKQVGNSDSASLVGGV
jgi:hypothetical protein